MLDKIVTSCSLPKVWFAALVLIWENLYYDESLLFSFSAKAKFNLKVAKDSLIPL